MGKGAEVTDEPDDEGCEACDSGMRCPVHMAVTAGTVEDAARRPKADHALDDVVRRAADG